MKYEWSMHYSPNTAKHRHVDKSSDQPTAGASDFDNCRDQRDCMLYKVHG